MCYENIQNILCNNMFARSCYWKESMNFQLFILNVKENDLLVSLKFAFVSKERKHDSKLYMKVIYIKVTNFKKLPI